MRKCRNPLDNLCGALWLLCASVVNRFPQNSTTETQRNTEFSQRLSRKRSTLRIILAIGLASAVYPQGSSDTVLNAVRSSDRAERAANGKFAPRITAAEHMRRASIYMTNRAFAPAREHWQAVVDNYPGDPNMPGALYGIGRSYYQERRYEVARQMFACVAQAYPYTKEGRAVSSFHEC